MKFLKKLLNIILILILLYSSSRITLASNIYEKLIIDDPKDSPLAFDIKDVFIKDDPHKLYFKVYGYKNFPFSKETNSYVGVSIDKDGYTDFTNFNNLDYLILLRRDGTKDTIRTYNYRKGATGAVSIESAKITAEVISMNDNGEFAEFSITKADIMIKNAEKVSFVTQIWQVSGNSFGIVDNAPDSSMIVYNLNFIRNTNPTLGVSSENIDLGSSSFDGELSGSLILSNEGINKLEGTLKTSSEKLRISVNKFTLQFVEKIEVKINVKAVDFGTREFNEKINIDSNGGKKTINVKFKFNKKPVLVFEPTELDFGEVKKGEKQSINLKISNSQEGPILGSLSSDLKFLTYSKNTLEGNPITIKVTADTSQLEPQKYEGLINISYNGGETSLQVYITVVAPKLAINSSEIDFGDVILNKDTLPPSKDLIIKNIGNSELTGSFINNANWFNLSESEFILNKNEEKKIPIIVELSKLEKGKNYSSDLQVKSNGGDAVLTVKLNCLINPPVLKVYNKNNQVLKEITLEIKQNDKLSYEFFIKNEGEERLDSFISLEKGDNSPFTISLKSLVLKSDSFKEIVLSFKEQQLPQLYQDIIIIKSNGGDLNIPISINVIREKLIVKLYIGKNEAFVGGKKVNLDVPPYIKNGTTFVPIRFISEAFGATVKWDASIGKGQITITYVDKTLILLIDSKVAYVNQKEYVLKEAPEIKNGRTFVPIRFISEAFGAKIEWNAKLQEVLIEL